MGCAFSGLFPLPLLSKLDVLPGQFEVALLPPPVLPTHSGQVPVWAWGTGKKGRMSLIQHQGLRGQERPHSTSVAALPSQAQFVAVNLVASCQHLSQNFGNPRKGVLKAVLLPVADLQLHQGKTRSCHEMPYPLCSQAQEGPT